MDRAIEFDAKVLRKQDDLPRYVIVKPGLVDGPAFAARISLNGCAPFDRNIRPWGKGSQAHFFNLTADQCRRAGVDTGDTCRVRIGPTQHVPGGASKMAT